MQRQLLPSVLATSTARRVLGLVALVFVLSGCQPCAPPLQYGAIGFVERSGELGVVLAAGVPEPYFYIGDGERDEVSVVWTTDARNFSSPQPMKTAGFDGLGQNRTICDSSGRCVQAAGGGEPSLSLQDRHESFPAPVPEHRRHVFTRVNECDAVNGAMAVALLPDTGELVVAYGEDGLAVLQEDGWDWRDVEGWQRRALVLTEVDSIADPLVGDLLEDVWFAIMGAVLMALVLVVGAVRRHRGAGQWASTLWLLAALVGVCVIGWPTAVILALFGVPALFAVTLVASALAGLVAVLLGSQLPRSVRRRHTISTGLGIVPGALAVLAWYLGMPIGWDAAMTLAAVVSAGGVLLTLGVLATGVAPGIAPLSGDNLARGGD